MNQDVLLWVGGVAVTLVGTLSLILLTRVLRTTDDTNRKVTEQGVSFARLEISVGHLIADVRSLNDWRQDVTNRALEVAEQRARLLEAERRSGPTDRRGIP